MTITNIVCGAIVCGTHLLMPHLEVMQHNIYGEYCKNCHCNFHGEVDPKRRDDVNSNIVYHVVSEGKSRETFMPMWGIPCGSYLVYPPKSCEYPVVCHYVTTNVYWTARPIK